MDMARWAATAALAFQVAWRWLRLAFDVFFFGTAIAPGQLQTGIVRCQDALRQIAKVKAIQCCCDFRIGRVGENVVSSIVTELVRRETEVR